MTAALRLKVAERDFQASVTDLATACGWRWVHHRPAWTDKGWKTAMSGSPGWPDLVLTRGTVALFVELKAIDGRLTAEQKAWIAALRVAGLDARVWRPCDWPEIETVLTQPPTQETTR